MPIMAVLSPVALAVVALAVHRLIPIGQSLPMTWMDSLPAWKHPFPIVLDVLLGASLLFGIAQWVCRPLRPWVRYYAPLVAGFIGLLCLWDLVTAKMAWMPQPFFPGPDEVLGALIEDTFHAAAVILINGGSLSAAFDALTDNRAILLVSTWHSLQLLLAGYFTGVVAGLVTGVTIGWFRLARYWCLPYLKLIGPVPATALVALAMMLSTNGFVCGMALIAFAVWFPVTVLTYSGITNVRIAYLDVARTLGAGQSYLVFRVAIPAALPMIFIGLFMGLLVSFLTLIAAETVGVSNGLGWYVQWQKGYAEYAKVWAALSITSVFCSGLLTLLFKTRDWVLKWQKGVIRW